MKSQMLIKLTICTIISIVVMQQNEANCNQSIQINNSTNIPSYQPLVLSGCSGVGKGTLVKYLLTKFPDLFELSISYTTRKPRPGETHGRQYFFVSKQQFEQQINKDSFAEYCNVHDNYYGTHQGRLQDTVKRGKICILEIDLQGGQKIYKKRPDYKFLFIEPPSIQELQHRLRTRGTQNEETIIKRMKNGRVELQVIKGLKFYDHLINDDLQVAEKQLIAYINRIYSLTLTA